MQFVIHRPLSSGRCHFKKNVYLVKSIMGGNQEDDLQIRKEAERDMDPRVDLAVERTELALERTQLAWVRTLLSMIGGGFVIDKAMEAVHQVRLESGKAWLNNGHPVSYTHLTLPTKR